MEPAVMRKLPTLAALAAVSTLVPVGLVALGANSANAAGTFPAHYAAPYLQIAGSDAGDLAADRSASGDKFYTLAFLTPKSGCTAEWEDGGDSVGAFSSQINVLKAAGGNVIISFGGAAGGELAQTCTSVSNLTAAYKKVVDTYGVTRLDFDIEGSVLDDSTANARRAQALAALQAAEPAVQIDFTVPVDPTGLESNAINLLKGAKSKGVKVNLVNIMTMDFGDGQNALADAESAAKATATQLESVYGVSASQAWNMLGLTPIAGQNDDNENFTQANASTLESFAASHGVQELAFWEVDGYDKGTGYAYSKIFNRITGGSTGGGGGGGSGQTYVGAQSGKCIDDNNSSTTNGTQLEIYTCNGGANQSIVTSGSTLQVEGKCADASGSQTANGTAVDINTCDGAANQSWTYNASTGTIVGAQSGKCITVQGASTANLAKLILYTCNGGANQKWTQQ
jgi:chitinase